MEALLLNYKKAAHLEGRAALVKKQFVFIEAGLSKASEHPSCQAKSKKGPDSITE